MNYDSEYFSRFELTDDFKKEYTNHHCPGRIKLAGQQWTFNY